MNCICEDMIEVGMDVHNPMYQSVDYKGFILHETYGVWWLKSSKDTHLSVDIFYCPFCGRKLNNWHWSDERRKENFERYFGK